MKIFGILMIVIAVLNFIAAIGAAFIGRPDAVVQKILGAMMLGIIGVVCYNIGKKKNKK